MAMISCVALSASLTSLASGDWRKGIWNRDVSENLLSLNIEALPIITEAFKNTTPWAGGFNLGYEYKMRPSIIHNKISFGLGGHIGVSRYFGKSISTPVYGHNLDQFWDHYKSYTEIPIMLDANVYWNFKRSNLFIGVSAGINLMLGQRDASLEMIDTINTKDFEDAYKLTHNKEVDMISIQKDANNVALNHILLTFRGMIGYTYELSQDWSLRVKAGVEYQGKYSDEFKGYHIDSDYIDRYHNEDSPSMLNPFFSIGIVYSL